MSARLAGAYPGVVEDNDDPQRAGRVRVRVPEVLGDVVTGWCLPVLPFAGPQVGLHVVPPVGALVHVLWTAGDTNRPPLWLGAGWRAGEVPDGSHSDAVSLVTASGSRIVVSEVAGQERIELRQGAAGATVELRAGRLALRIGASSVVLTEGVVEVNDGALRVV
jgi:hypothetical protein